MVIDTSALVAILLDEPERPEFNAMIAAADSRLLSMATFLETAIVVEARYGAEGSRELDLLLDLARFEFVAVDREQAKLAREAWRRFGKGQHPAGLNFGDCFAYALARTLDQPLLFKGTDFSQTDVTACRLPG
jgi:ribonuclease VapC